MTDKRYRDVHVTDTTPLEEVPTRSSIRSFRRSPVKSFEASFIADTRIVDPIPARDVSHGLPDGWLIPDMWKTKDDGAVLHGAVFSGTKP